MRHFTRALTRTFAALACAVALATCADAPTGPGRGGTPVRLAFAPQFTTSATSAASALRQAGIEVASVRVVIRRTSNGDELFNRVITVAPGASSITLEADVLLRSSEEELTAFMEFLDAAGTILYRGEQQVLARAGGDNAVTVDTEIEFVGPGATAATVRVTPADTTISTATPLALNAVALDAAGAPITSAILLWSSSDALLATVNASGLVTPVGPRGTVQVSARTPLGIAGSATLRLMPPAVRIVLIGGGSQVGTAGSTLPQPFTVEVQAADGLPVAGETVAFSAVTSGGAVTNATVTTDAQGRASTPIKLGTAAGRYEFRAISGSLGAVTISADATPGTATAMAILSGDGQSATVGTSLAAPLVVKVRDGFGNPVTGATVKWQVLTGSGTLAAATSTSDASGHAAIAYKVGNSPATETIKATLDGTSVTVTFTVTATLGAASQIAIVSGNGQTGDEGSMLASALVVQVKDALGNLVPGAPVTWSVTSGSATLAQATTSTDANAKASNTVTLGNPAVMPASVAIKATLASGASVTFNATIVALPPVPAQLKVVSQPASAAVGAVMSPPLSVRVADANGVSIAQPGVAVTASVYAPSASVAPAEKGGMSAVMTTMRELVGTTTVTTDATGTATFTDLALTGSVGEVQVAFSATGLAGAVSSSINLVAGTPQSVAIVSGDGQTAEEGTQLPAPLVVIVTDAAGNATPGITVAWAVTSGNAAVAQATTTTDASATTNNTVTLGTPETLPATAIITATIASGASTTFTATITPAPLVPAKLVITQQPSTGAIGAMLAPAYKVQVADADGQPVPQAGLIVEATLRAPVFSSIPVDSAPRRAARSTASSERTLAGTVTVATNSAGVAEFGDLSITGATGSVEIEFSSTNLAGVVSTALTLTHGAVAAVAIRPALPDGPLTVHSGSPVQDNLWAATVDASGNPVPNVPLTFSVRADTPDGTEVATGSAQSDANGVFHASLFPVPSDLGTYYLRISVPQTTIPAAIIGVQVVPPPASSLTPVPVAFDPVSDTVLTQEELAVVLKDPQGAPIANATIAWQMPGEPPMAGLRAPTPLRAPSRDGSTPLPAFSVSEGDVFYYAGFIVNGSVEHSTSTTTDANGVAKVMFARGTVAGTITLGVTAPGHDAVASFPVEVAAGKPALIHVEQGASTAARAGIAFEQQPIVSLRDMWNNPARQAGIAITAVGHWYGSDQLRDQSRASMSSSATAVAPTTASVAASAACSECEGPQYLIGTRTVTTDAMGRATFSGLALGAEADTYIITYENEELELYGFGCSDYYNCSDHLIVLSAGPAAKWQLSPETDAPPVQSSLWIHAELYDAWNNRIIDGKERALTWAVSPTSPAGSFEPAGGTNTTGRDSTWFTVADTPTDHLVTLSHVEDGLGTISGSVTINAVQPVPASEVQIVEGDNQIVDPGKPLAPLRVRVMNSDGMPVAGSTVRWSAGRYRSLNEYGDYIYPTTSVTDAEGYATSPALTLPSEEDRTGYVVHARALRSGEGTPYASFRAVARPEGYTHVWMGPLGGMYDGTPYWSTAALWNEGTVPTASSNVLIPDFDPYDWAYPTLESSVTVNDLMATGYFSQYLDLGANTLTVAGNLRAAVVAGTGTISLTGAGKLAEVDFGSGTVHVAASADVQVTQYLNSRRLVVNGRVDVGRNYIQAYDTLRVEGATATVVMAHRDAELWSPNVIFDGAASGANLADGYLQFSRSFTQRNTYSAASFAPGANFEVVGATSYNTDTATVSFATPGAAQSYFSSVFSYYGTVKQLSPVHVRYLGLSTRWLANGITADTVEIENAATLQLAGTGNLLRYLILESGSNIDAQTDNGTVTVEACVNYGATTVAGVSLPCSVEELRAAPAVAATPAEEGGEPPRRVLRTPPERPKPLVRPTAAR